MPYGKSETQHLAREFADRGDPNGWFEAFYARAKGDIHEVYWADLEPNPFLCEWVASHPAPADARAVTVGCGLGDDAEWLARQGYATTAFDISPSAIAMCQARYPDNRVQYQATDLFDHPPAWQREFDLVYECNTIQILTGADRERAVPAIADLVAPGGSLLVSCRSRNPGEGRDSFPLALDRDELNGFSRAGLNEVHFLAYDDSQNPPVPHFFAVFDRPA